MDIAGLIPSFGNLFYTIGAFVVALSVIVAIHEFGHYIVGRWCGIYSEVFSLGFGPVLFSRVDSRGTRWQVAALPFGGYVKFLGDEGVASDKASDVIEEMDDEARRRTMHGAPLWARAATVVAGPMFNFILSIAIFGGFALFIGVSTNPPVIEKLYPLPTPGIELQVGDTILAIEDIPYPDSSGYVDFENALPAQPLLNYTVLRDGREVVVKGPPLSPPRVGSVAPDQPAGQAGLQVGDVILSLNGVTPVVFEDMIDVVNSSGGAPIVVEYWRPNEDGTGGTVAKLSVQPKRRDVRNPDNSFETRWLLGVGSSLPFEPAARTPGPFEALSIGVQQTVGLVEISLSGLYHMVIGAISTCGLSGPIGIAKGSGQAASQGAASFIWFIAALSTAVGMLNLFPIPILDGGHLVFHVYEALTGRPPSDRALRLFMSVGLALLLALMVFAVSNDLFCP